MASILTFSLSTKQPSVYGALWLSYGDRVATEMTVEWFTYMKRERLSTIITPQSPELTCDLQVAVIFQWNEESTED